MDATTMLGFVAAAFTTFAFLPQVLKTWRLRSAEDLSIPTFALFTTGIVLWLVYGVLTADAPIIVANVITFALASAVLVMAWRFGQGAERPPDGD